MRMSVHGSIMPQPDSVTSLCTVVVMVTPITLSPERNVTDIVVLEVSSRIVNIIFMPSRANR